MKLEIMSLRNALQYVPEDNTYAIRICGERTTDHLHCLEKSDKWIGSNWYVFDDVWPDIPGGLEPMEVVFNEKKAEKIITDFREKKENIETLLVHCHFGQNRSPAVGIALNDLFDLGYNSNQLKREFPDYREFVYDAMIETGKKMMI
jgi:hypothetical protein